MKYTKEKVERLLGNGMSLRSVARKFGVSYQTIQYHRRMWKCAPLREARTYGDAHASWKGGYFIDRNGYKMVLAPERGKCSRYAMEHVLIAESSIGRHLKPDEAVHHLNGIKSDNRPQNLLVVTRSKHRILHRQLESIGYELISRGMVSFNGERYVLKI